MAHAFEFDPLAVENVGVTLAVELLQQPTTPFPPIVRFNGPGVYALYYSGDHPAYAPLVALDAGRSTFPVYIGRAARANANQGFSPQASTGKELYDRLRAHYRSMRQTNTLDVTHFKVRHLVLKPAYINLAESVLIMAFRPPWNGMGLGSNQTGEPRMAGQGSMWDALHPGRTGRPAGGAVRANEAAALIASRVAQLHQPSADPVIRRMHDRIMKFV